ncbi:cation diffusion facilitator family transporter [Streptoalloteichus tenebrarius]|uniref:Cation diffusion facilitator family transporter n=1 Tax=Streptoalloteichus tenebrarius (strain ATCC 17920 / DSM 40477 / JCM 4838 / CBS 697.72 / NBRC 16177 / NCIMB 11028 / NRRL B-12390 / A12253. 1 / ISP 5477) TaxID=1933 RepID=A0ABT1I2K6_STRSD|nr:cation diffusion facilitator family transporter [Streptoalloteichus tenebrarius]BFF02128.1 cation diffusion facilitator family transporter [Streptoalloteichus tenebrarius]
MVAERRNQHEGGESTLTVVLALMVNLGIAVMKAVAGAITGSAALLAEAAHSVADTFTEGLLLTALRRSARPADRRHPFGYGKERYFWSLMAAVSIFASGAVFAFVEGVRTLAGEGQEQVRPLVGYVVLALAFALELVSWTQAVRQVRREARAEKRGVPHYLRLSDDPTVKTVLLEDSAALVGLLLAFAGLGLHDLTGSAVWDGVASLAIGVLLVVVAYTLGRTNKGLLIGRQADPRLVRRVYDWLTRQREVEAVVDLLTMVTGTDRVLLCARVDFDDSLGVAELERTCVRLATALRDEFAELDEIFLEPVPRADPHLRARVLARYGEITRRQP